MSISVRLVMPEDREQLRGLARAAAAESEPDLGFDDATFGESFGMAVTGSLTLYVAEHKGRLLGFALCDLDGWYFTAGFSAVLHVLYVAPDYRGTRAPALLMQQFIDWGRDTVRAKRLYLGINTGFRPGYTARFFEKFGARQVGPLMVIGHG